MASRALATHPPAKLGWAEPPEHAGAITIADTAGSPEGHTAPIRRRAEAV